MIKSCLAIFLIEIVSLSSLVAGQAIRLVDGRAPYEGRVEISVSGQWGTVCDDDFGVEEARVVCRQLGYNDIYQADVGFFGVGRGEIVLDNLKCTGEEDSLMDCDHLGIRKHNCDHSEDAGVACGGNGGNGCVTPTPCWNGEGCPFGDMEAIDSAEDVCPVCRCEHFSNVALHKPATQSTHYSYGPYAIPGMAVDGNKQTSVQYCTHSADPDYNPNRWWRVDLLEHYEVHAVAITNRGDCCGDRTSNFDITVSEDEFNPFHSYGVNILCLHRAAAIGLGATERLECNQPIVGRHVTLVVYTTTWPINFCEMEVLTPVCPTRPTCPENCANGRTEYYDTAVCPMCRCVPRPVTSEETEESDSITTELLIAASTVMMVLLIILVVLVIYVCRQKRLKRHPKRRRMRIKVNPVGQPPVKGNPIGQPPIATLHDNWFPGAY